MGADGVGPPDAKMHRRSELGAISTTRNLRNTIAFGAIWPLPWGNDDCRRSSPLGQGGGARGLMQTSGDQFRLSQPSSNRGGLTVIFGRFPPRRTRRLPAFSLPEPECHAGAICLNVWRKYAARAPGPQEGRPNAGGSSRGTGGSRLRRCPAVLCEAQGLSYTGQPCCCA